MGDRAGQTCGNAHTQHTCFSRLDDAWRAEFGDEVERPHWAELLRSGVAIFDLDHDAILSSMYALSASAEGDCYRCVPPDLGIEAAALGAGKSSLPGTALAEALHNFTLDSGASRCFFCDSTTLTPLLPPVLVRLADPFGGPVVARSSTDLLCPASVSSSASGSNQDLPNLRLHSDRGGEFSSDLLLDFCRGEGILKLFTLPDSPQQNGVAERHIGFIMEVARTSMIHAVRLQLRERFREDLPVLHLHSDRGGEYSSDLLWDFFRGEGNLQSFTLPASPQQNGIAKRRIGLVMEVARTSMIHAAAPHFLWSFAVRYAAHQLNLWPRVSLAETSPTLRWTGEVGDASMFRVWGSRAFVRDASADKLSTRAIPCDNSVPFYPLFPYRSAPPPPPPLFLAPGPPPVNPLLPQGPAPSGVSQVDPLLGSAPVEAWGAEPASVYPGVAEPKGVEPGGAESEGAESGGAEPRGAASSGGPAGASPRLSPQQLREWLVRRARLRSGATGAGGTGDTGAEGAGITAGAGGTGGTAHAGPGGALTRGTGAAGTGGVGGAGAGDPTEPGAAGAGGAGAGATGALQHELDLEDLELEALAQALALALTVTALSAVASTLIAKLLDFAAACRLDYATALVDESKYAGPLSVEGECALGMDVLEDRQEDFERLAAAVPRFASMLLAPEGDPDAPDIPTPRSYTEAITSPYSSQWQAARDAEMASWKSTGTYVYEVPPPGANIVDSMWTFRVKRPPVYGLRQAPREWEDTLRTTVAGLGFAPSTADLSLILHTDTSLPPFYVLVYVNDLVFATTDTDALTLVKLELLKRHTCTDMGELRSYLGLEITRDRAWRTITLTQPHMVHQVLQRFGFLFSSPQPTPLSTNHSLSAPPSDESVEPSGPYPELVGCVITSGMGLVLGAQGLVVLTGHADAFWVHDSATQRSSQGNTFSLGSDSVSWRSTRSSYVLSSSCEVEIYAGAMAAQEQRWLTYLVSALGEQPRSPPVLYVDNKAMIALCREHIMEHRTKHIALQYFLARELQQRGQLRLAYVATRANTANIFTKALPPGDHQRFSTVLGLVPTLPHLLTT
ncbi:unnamed protein product [Closterium sp. NIES-54]